MENQQVWRLSITYDSGSDAYPQQVNLNCTSLTTYDEFREQLCKELQIPIKAQFSIFVHATTQKNEAWVELSNPQMLSTSKINKLKIMPKEYEKKERKKKQRAVPYQPPKKSPVFQAPVMYPDNMEKIPLHPLLQNNQQKVVYYPVVYYVQSPQQNNQQSQGMLPQPSYPLSQGLGQQMQQNMRPQYFQPLQQNIQDSMQIESVCQLPSVQDITKFNL